jgi:hypothetical protein
MITIICYPQINTNISDCLPFSTVLSFRLSISLRLVYTTRSSHFLHEVNVHTAKHDGLCVCLCPSVIEIETRRTHLDENKKF